MFQTAALYLGVLTEYLLQVRRLAALLALLLAFSCGKLLMAQERSLKGAMQAPPHALCRTAPNLLKCVDMHSVPRSM